MCVDILIPLAFDACDVSSITLSMQVAFDQSFSGQDSAKQQSGGNTGTRCESCHYGGIADGAALLC